MDYERQLSTVARMLRIAFHRLKSVSVIPDRSSLRKSRSDEGEEERGEKRTRAVYQSPRLSTELLGEVG